MKTLTTLLSSAIIASVSLVGLAQADELMDIIHPESADLFDHSTSFTASTPTDIVSLSDNRGSRVWSFEYEQYVNPQDFLVPDYANLDINAYMEENPAAAGGRSGDILRWDDTADEYQLQ
jgi:hypothetical protein